MLLNLCHAEKLVNYFYMKETRDTYDHITSSTVPVNSTLELTRNICCGHGYCSPAFKVFNELQKNSSVCCDIKPIKNGCICRDDISMKYICGTNSNCSCWFCTYLKPSYFLMKYNGIQCSIINQRVYSQEYDSIVPGIVKKPINYFKNPDQMLTSSLKQKRIYPDITIELKEGTLYLQTLNGTITWLRLGGAIGSKEYIDLSGFMQLNSVCPKESKDGFITIEYEHNSVHYGPETLTNQPYDVCDHISNCWYCLKRYECEQGFVAFIIALIWICLIIVGLLASCLIILLIYKTYKVILRNFCCCNFKLLNLKLPFKKMNDIELEEKSNILSEGNDDETPTPMDSKPLNEDVIRTLVINNTKRAELTREEKENWLLKYQSEHSSEHSDTHTYGSGHRTHDFKIIKKANSKIWMILIIALCIPLVFCTECTNVFGISGSSEVCTTNGTVTSCLMQDSTTLTLPGVGSKTCYNLRTHDGILLQNVYIELVDYFQKTEYVPIYYTDDYNIIPVAVYDSGSAAHVEYCNDWSVCNPQHVCGPWGYHDDQHPWVNTICKPGYMACSMCGGGYGSLYYGWVIAPGPMGKMAQVETTDYVPVYNITVADATGTYTSIKTLRVGEYFNYHGLTMSRGVESVPKTLDMAQWKLLTFNNKAYLCVASDVTANTAMMMGDVQRTCPSQDTECMRAGDNIHYWTGTAQVCRTSLPQNWPNPSLQDCTPTMTYSISGWKNSFSTACKDITTPIIINGFTVVAQYDATSNSTYVVTRTSSLTNVNLNINTNVDSVFSIFIQDSTLTQLEVTCDGTSGVYGNVKLHYTCKCKYFEKCQVALSDENESFGFITCDGSSGELNILSSSETYQNTLYASNMHAYVACETPTAYIIPNSSWTGSETSVNTDDSISGPGNLFGFLDYFADLPLAGKIGISALMSLVPLAFLILIVYIILRCVRSSRERRYKVVPETGTPAN